MISNVLCILLEVQMSTTGTSNNTKVVLRRVTSASDRTNTTFVSVKQGENPTADLKYSLYMVSGNSVYSNNLTNDSTLTKVDVNARGIPGRVPAGGKRTYSSTTTVKDYNLTGAGATRVLDIYGRVVKISGTDIVVNETSSGAPRFEQTSTTLTGSDTAPGNGTYTSNKGLVYYTKITAKSAPTVLTVDSF